MTVMKYMKNNFKIPKKVYGVKIKDKSKLMESQSGGAFTAIAEWFLEHGAVVYGCGMDSSLNAVYKRISCIDDLHLIKGSKYVQAFLGDTFECVRKDLDCGRIVLFSGTPCYVYAVQKVVSLNTNRNNLYTIDIICHGVPSPLVYKTYLRELEEIANSKISAYIFRDKKEGWSKHVEKVKYENGLEEIREDYTRLFYTNLSLRPSCGKCPFSRIDRTSDFTIGDFWGVQNTFPAFKDDKGVSIVFLNSQRGISIFSEIADKMEILETDIDHGMQPNLKYSSRIPVLKNYFWKDFRKNGTLYCVKKWPPIIELPIVIKSKIKKFVGRFC